MNKSPIRPKCPHCRKACPIVGHRIISSITDVFSIYCDWCFIQMDIQVVYHKRVFKRYHNNESPVIALGPQI